MPVTCYYITVVRFTRRADHLSAATMAKSSVAGECFDYLVKYALAVCKKCRHSVLPSQIKSHLQRAHRVRYKQAKLIADKVSSWARLIKYASKLEVPSRIIELIY